MSRRDPRAARFGRPYRAAQRRADVSRFTRALVAMSVSVKLAAERLAAFGRAANEVEEVRRLFWRVGIAPVDQEPAFAEALRLQRETGAALLEAAEQVAHAHARKPAVITPLWPSYPDPMCDDCGGTLEVGDEVGWNGALELAHWRRPVDSGNTSGLG